jgi:muconolactone delta-isomerase
MGRMGTSITTSSTLRLAPTPSPPTGERVGVRGRPAGAWRGRPDALCRWLGVCLCLLACKQEHPPAPPPAPRAFSRSDLAAAALLDAKLARAALLTTRLQLAAEGGAAAIRDRARGLAPEISAAVSACEQALLAVSHPADRAPAERAVAAARRFLPLTDDLRAGAGSPAALHGAADELGRAVLAYRQARSGYAMAAPPEGGAALAFTQARAALERAEAELGRSLPAAAGAAARAPEAAAARALRAAGALDEPWRSPALRWAEAQAQAIEALGALSATPEAGRGVLALRYQQAKADALEALAAYERVRAER